VIIHLENSSILKDLLSHMVENITERTQMSSFTTFIRTWSSFFLNFGNKFAILSLILLRYGFTNIFSGQRLYDNLLSQFYNTLFAALPIILYALFDKQYPDKAFETHPSLYDLGKKSKLPFLSCKFTLYFRSNLQN